MKALENIEAEMKVVGLNCSAGKNGNTSQAVRLALNHLESLGLRQNTMI